MIRKLKNAIVTLLSVATLSLPVLAPVSVAAQADVQGNLCGGAANLSLSEQEDCEDEEGEDSLNNLITNIVNIFSVVVGVISVIMIIIGGFKYITSGGDSNSVTNAKNTIMYAIIGLVIVALAQFIVRFVLDRAAGAT